ncbi:hypothetical protein FQR65_LT20137 [Abscondita terminalis]|nr:hypothetical protein FQR65_LT20137 [Abscondita terminalis]
MPRPCRAGGGYSHAPGASSAATRSPGRAISPKRRRQRPLETAGPDGRPPARLAAIHHAITALQGPRTPTGTSPHRHSAKPCRARSWRETDIVLVVGTRSRRRWCLRWARHGQHQPKIARRLLQPATRAVKSATPVAPSLLSAAN